MANQYYDRKIQSLFPVGAKVTGFIFMGLGFFAILGGFYLAVILLLAGAFVALAYSGVQIDLENKKFREYGSFLGFKFGTFNIIPELSNIVIFYHSAKVSNNMPMGGAQSHSTETTCRANLKGENKKFTLTVSSGSKKNVMEDAMLLSEIFIVEVVDLTVKSKTAH